MPYQDLEDHIEEDVIILREIPKEQAKQEILSYYREYPSSYPSDVADELQLDQIVVRDLCIELINEGKLGPA